MLTQEASAISFAPLGMQKTNYFLQSGILSGAESNNYGIQLSLLYNLANPDGVWKGIQIGGVNMGGSVQIGVCNLAYGDMTFQIGLVNSLENNVGKNCIQIGLLNYNEESWIPFLPFLNFSFE